MVQNILDTGLLGHQSAQLLECIAVQFIRFKRQIVQPSEMRAQIGMAKSMKSNQSCYGKYEQQEHSTAKKFCTALLLPAYPIAAHVQLSILCIHN